MAHVHTFAKYCPKAGPIIHLEPKLGTIISFHLTNLWLKKEKGIGILTKNTHIESIKQMEDLNQRIQQTNKIIFFYKISLLFLNLEIKFNE
ncbi:hypothetical protein BpHYR1_000308 [Brachionus plicatilis]|uniref:Uncharacterized protein n=1 Tax=Brachionus plicatilis TaxID=10195 RepID=A0A3M7SI98_BRAPC|nr:hypothetical protein BpHYR1_000308 [Brachionus plicatilis]